MLELPEEYEYSNQKFHISVHSLQRYLTKTFVQKLAQDRLLKLNSKLKTDFRRLVVKGVALWNCIIPRL